MILLQAATDTHLPPLVGLVFAGVITVACVAFIVGFWWLLLGADTDD